MNISDRAYLVWANKGFEAGAKVAVAEYLLELASRGVDLSDDATLTEITGSLDPGAA